MHIGGTPRRTVLAGVVAFATAGCLTEYAPSGPRNPPSGGEPPAEDSGSNDRDVLQITEWDFLEADDGSLIVELYVRNDTDTERTGTVTVRASTGGVTESQSAEVTVTPDDEEIVHLEYDFGYDEFTADGSLELEVS